MTRHVRHSFMSDDHTNPKNIHFMQQFIKCKYSINPKNIHFMQQIILCKSSIPFMLQQKENLIDWCIPYRPCVHHGTFPNVRIDNLYSSKY